MKWGVAANKYWVSFAGDENVLKLLVMVAQHNELNTELYTYKGKKCMYKYPLWYVLSLSIKLLLKNKEN